MVRILKLIYSFGHGRAEGRTDQKQLLGGKGAGLAEMTRIGIPVPAGFTITTEACAEYDRLSKRRPPELDNQIRAHLKKLEKGCKRRLGDAKHPLLVSVRSGAAVSMPGMMETILNLGLNDVSVEGLAKETGNRRFALDAYRRLIMMYGNTAKGIDRGRFDDAFDRIKDDRTRARLGRGDDQSIADTDVNADELAELIDTFKNIYREETNDSFPQDPLEQLNDAIDAVFDSWMAEKAITYRRVEKITGLAGTAVNVCQMVFGNLGDDSGTGVCFTRDPSTGENVFYGDLLINAQGEDVVAGVRTPMKIAELMRLLPKVWLQLLAVRAILEVHYKDMQDLEFTVEREKLYLLQCRTGKRSPAAAFKIAVEQATLPLLSSAEAKELVKRKLLPSKYAGRATKPIITKEEAITRISAADIERLFYPVIDPEVSRDELDRKRLGSGINAVPGAACGIVVFNAEDATREAANDKNVILVRKETSPEDVGGMHAAVGILTATGGKTSHAAVVARGWGKCCIVGCETLRVDEEARTMSLNGRVLREGDTLTLDGSSGDIYDADLPLVRPSAPREFDTFMGWCDEVRRMRVRANADTPDDARRAIELGAEGIGLCRTEHMFFETKERRLAMQEMIVADSPEDRRSALDKLQPFQKQDFLEIFEVMDGKPVTIRLVDPPLHEFLPHTDDGIRQLAEHTGMSVERIRDRTEQLHESNPMLGHRGCRLCITYPEILEMQVGAIIEAAVDAKRQGVTVLPEIMIPLTIDAKELLILTDQTRAVADAILDNAGILIDYTVGTMVETPRAALLADRFAHVAQFISFGTNDLTQTTMGLSRDDAGRFLPAYVDQDKCAIFADDPFHSLDQDGVGLLVDWACKKARSVDPSFKLGVCGEHGGEPESIRFFHRVGLDYISCSPVRLPIARFAAAQVTVARESKPGSTSRRAQTAPESDSGRAAKKGSAPRKSPSRKKTAKRKKTSASKARRSEATPRARTKAKRPAGKTTPAKRLKKRSKK